MSKLIFSRPGAKLLTFDDRYLDYIVDLRSIMETRSLTVDALARCCGCSDQAIYDIINGRHDPSLSLLIRLCVVLNCSVSDLVEICDLDATPIDDLCYLFI